MTAILAFDPGSAKSGWCKVAVTGVRPSLVTLSYVESGEVLSTRDAVRSLIANSEADVVAIEMLAGIAYPVKGAGIVSALVASSNVAGMIAALAYAEGRQVAEMTATQWRRMVIGKGNASDKAIAQTIPRLVREWPKRSNVHERDAAGLAIATAWQMSSRATKTAVGG